MTATITSAQYRAMTKKAKKPGKYRNIPVTVDGVRFASRAEARRDAELVLLERAGKIADLKRQPRFKLEVGGELIAVYVADWSYVIPSKTVAYRVVEDKKGGKATQTAAFKLKWKLAQALFPEIAEWIIS